MRVLRDDLDCDPNAEPEDDRDERDDERDDDDRRVPTDVRGL